MRPSYSFRCWNLQHRFGCNEHKVHRKINNDHEYELQTKSNLKRVEKKKENLTSLMRSTICHCQNVALQSMPTPTEHRNILSLFSLLFFRRDNAFSFVIVDLRNSFFIYLFTYFFFILFWSSIANVPMWKGIQQNSIDRTTFFRGFSYACACTSNTHTHTWHTHSKPKHKTRRFQYFCFMLVHKHRATCSRVFSIHISQQYSH